MSTASFKFKSRIDVVKRNRRWFPWVWSAEIDGRCVGADVAMTLRGALRAASRSQRKAVLRRVP